MSNLPHQDLVDKEPRYIENRNMTGWETVVGNFFSDFVFEQMIPSTGAIVELGTGQGRNFLELCRQFGEQRCVGYDVVNFLNHPQVRQQDIRKLSVQDDYPIALGFNDLSDWELSPQSKKAGFEFIKRNLVDGGYYIDAAFSEETANLIDLSDFSLIEERDSVMLFQYRANQDNAPKPLASPWEFSTSFWQWFDRLQIRQRQALRLRNSSRSPIFSAPAQQAVKKWLGEQEDKSLVRAHELFESLCPEQTTVSQFVSGYLRQGTAVSDIHFWVAPKTDSLNPFSFHAPAFALPIQAGEYNISIQSPFESPNAPSEPWEIETTDVLFIPEGSKVTWSSQEPDAALLLIQMGSSVWKSSIGTGRKAIEDSVDCFSITANYTQSLQHSYPDTYSRLLSEVPLVESITLGFQKELRLPQTIKPPSKSYFKRYQEHYRSVNLPLAPLCQTNSAQGAVIIKGSEPLCDDFEDLIDWMNHSTFRGPSNFGHSPMLEHFPLHENKIPGALGLREAEAEFEIALRFQTSHLKHYGEFAKMPIPLAVHQIADETTSSIQAILESYLSQKAMNNISHLLCEGLGSYLYYYPGTPDRVRTSARALNNESEVERIRRLEKWQPEFIIRQWATLFARIIHLGYLPYSFHNESLGAVFDAGNACMDGGFVDLDSLIEINQMKTDDAFFDALGASLLGLIRTASELLPHSCHRETKDLFVRQYIMNEVQEALVKQMRPTLDLDARVWRFFDKLSFQELCTQLQTRQRYTTAFLSRS